MFPGRMPVERIAGLIEGDVLRQRDRQIGLRHRHRAAGFAMDDRDRAAPIALARNAPVAQPEIDLALAAAASPSNVSVSSRRATSSFAAAIVIPSRKRELIKRPSPS